MHEIDSLVPLSHTCVRGMRIVVTSELVRVKHPDYPGCERLRTMSKEEMISGFCKCLVDWGDR